jgi:hypothetical protein
MNAFPRTDVGGLSLSRMIIGTNWFLGYSHATPAKDALIQSQVKSREKMADIIEVFLRAGVDTIMGPFPMEPLADAVCEAQDRTGIGAIIIATPSFTIGPNTPRDGFDMADVDYVLDAEAELGARFIMPHTGTTDPMVDRCTREVRQMAPVCAKIRERGMIPGLSTHLPESIIYSDETGLDVETYISIFNSMGFLMPLEVDWTLSVIRAAKKPVMTIKPMAAGQLRPLQALTFVWNTIRPQDMVTVGTMTPDEARELIDLSLQILDRQVPQVALQATRSKASVQPKG